MREKESTQSSFAPIQSLLRCPYSGQSVAIGENGLKAGEITYPIVDGIATMVDKEQVAPLDEYFQEQYGEKTAKNYDWQLKLLSLLFGCRESVQRGRLAKLLKPPAGGRLLEVAVGTGANLPYLTKAMEGKGEIVGIDLSLPMMKVAQKVAQKVSLPVYFIQADGCHLPFASNSFDAVFHFGGINMFGSIGRGIEEIIRVAKPGAPILISDEGMSEKFRRKWLGKKLAKMNSLNLCRPPFAHLPWPDLQEFELHWVWRELFYVLRFCKSMGKPLAKIADVEEEIQRRISPAG